MFGKSNPKQEHSDILIFANRDIQNAQIPSNVSRIENFAFDHCMNLKTINFSEDSQLRSIGNNSFSYSSIELLYLPPLIESIGKFSFYCCEQLKSVNFRKYSQIEKIEKYFFLILLLKTSLSHQVF